MDYSAELGKEIWLLPGIRGYGYYTPDSTSETFRLRNSLFNYTDAFLLGTVTDTASPDLNDDSSAVFLEYEDTFGNLKYIKIDDSLIGRIEFVNRSGDLDDEVTLVKEVESTAVDKIPFWKQNLGKILLGVLGFLVIFVLIARQFARYNQSNEVRYYEPQPSAPKPRTSPKKKPIRK